MYYIKKTTDNILDNIPETPGGVLMNFPLKWPITASHFSVDSILYLYKNKTNI